MKKTYKAPEMEVVKINARHTLLAGSPDRTYDYEENLEQL